MYFTPLTNPGAPMPATEQFTPITRPSQCHVNVDPNRRACPSEGFNYPTFRLVNKNTRVYLSEPFTLDSLITYRPFAVASAKGWFAAVRKIGDAQDIIFSPLGNLRDSFKNTSEDDKGFFFPQRDLSLDVGLPTIVAFALNDTRLVVGVDNGSIHVYDTAQLFSSGSDSISPLRTYSPQAGALRQIAPNPGTEPDLVDTIAVVRSDGVVQLMNTMLESLGGWSSADPNVSPVAVSWSPKGKHLAIGLQSGDILTFAPNNMSTPNKHIPSAADGRLFGLNWLSPGHTFRLTYAPHIANEGEPIQQIVSLDAKSNTLVVFDTLHPFVMADRQQESHALILPHWDEGSISENSKSLVLVGDRASIDLEILGGHNGQWHQQSQENPVSLPLDKQTEETTLMNLDLDLTDLGASMPIVYAYLNDGSLQAWYLEHSKPYLKMVSSTAEAALAVQSATDISQDSAMDEKDAANVLTSLSNPNQPPVTSSFGTFTSNTGHQNSAFGAASQPTSVFGQTPQPAFGQSSGFGSLSSGSAFGRPSSFGSSQPTSSVFGSPSPGNAFANIAVQRDTTNVFGVSSFSAGLSSTSPPTQLALSSDEMTREASMSDGTTPSFGGLSLGGASSDTGDTKPKASIFGSFSAAPSPNQPATPAFSGPIKPAQGFGAFNSSGPAASIDTSNQEKPPALAFSSPPQSTPHSTFGQTGFGKPAFGQPSFGQASLGRVGFGKPSPATAAGSGGAGFAAFASSSPSSFGSALQANKATPSAPGGFAGFASTGTSAFGPGFKPEQLSASQTNTPSPFSADGSVGPFRDASSAFAKNGNSFADLTSNLGLRGSSEATTTLQSGSAKPLAGAMSPPSSPEPSKSGSPFDNRKIALPSSPSVLRESTAFTGLKAMQESSPFFKKHEDKTTSVTAFGNVGQTSAFKPLSPTTTTATPAFGATSQLGTGNKSPFSSNASTVTPAFGAISQLGAAKSIFESTTPETTPTKPAVGGGFSAFIGANTGFSAFSGPKTSFSDLLKGGDKNEGETEKLTTPSKPISVFASQTPIPVKPSTVSVSTTPKTPTPSIATRQEESTTPKGTPGEEKPEPSTSTPSVSSMGSFVDVSADKSYEEVGEVDDEVDDTRSFLSSDFSSGPPTDAEESEEEDQPTKEGGNLGEVSDGRSPSPTPQPEVPLIHVSPSPPAEAGRTQSGKEESTTPPGSPSRETKAPSKSPSPTPFSTPSTPSTPSSPSPSPFGIGLGRPSTRPARSSPLAAAPVSGEDEEEEESQAKEEPVSKPLASPKPIFGRLSPAREEPVKQGDDDTTLRPRTPPLLASFDSPAIGKATPTAPKPEPAKAPSLSPVSQQPASVFSGPAEPPTQPKQETPIPTTTSKCVGLPSKSPMPPDVPQVPKTAPVTPTGSPFSLPSFSLAPRSTSVPQSQTTPGPATPLIFPQAGPSIFSAPPMPPTETQSNRPAAAGSFAAKHTTNATELQPGQTPPTMPQPAPSVVPVKTAPPAPPVEEGLQKECVVIVKTIESELEELSDLGVKAAQRCADLCQGTGGSRLKTDLGALEKWKISDAMTFGQTLLQFEKDLEELKGVLEAAKQVLCELNSSMLKANTRREEISRFNKAKTDKEFAKMLSTRSLGPEHLESQLQLRRGIRAMRDRIQKLESHLQESKKKLSQAASGRPSIRAPTLDVINRTYRNIDLAIQQQTDEVAKLTDRVAKLKIGAPNLSSPTRDVRLPDRRRSIVVTPHVAVTTAAALNAERSAQKLKKALLKVRKQPILNMRAALAPPPPSESETPQKLPAGPGSFGSVPGPLFIPSAEVEVVIPDMNFNLPEDNFHPGTPLPSSRRGVGSNPKKHGSVPLKKTVSGTTQSPPPPADFWGPLPVFNNPPPNKLAAEVKPFVPLTPSTPTPINKAETLSSLPGGGFEAFMKHPS